MNEFEKELQQRLQNEKIPELHSEHLWSRIQEQHLNEKKGRKDMIRFSIVKQWIVAVSLIAALTVAGGGYGNDIVHAASSLWKEVFGSIEQVRQVDPHAHEQMLENELQAAKHVLTETEYKQYTALFQEQTRIMQKAIEIVDGKQKIHMDRLSPEDKNKLEQNEKLLRPLINKIDNQFVYSIDGAAPMLPFPVKHPAYVPSGYTLSQEVAKAASTTGDPQPIVSFTYKKGEFGFTVRQSVILTGEADEYSLRSIEKEESYNLNGNQVKYGRIGKNVTAMKMIVPERGSRSSYQIYIIADVLSKQEVEKIALSILEK